MKCESVRKQLTAYLDGELEGDHGSAVRGHLRGCEECRRVAADEAALRDGLRALPPLDPPVSLWAGVQAKLAAAEVADAEKPAWRRMLSRLTPRAPQLAFASVALAAAVVLIVVRRNETTVTTPPKPEQLVTPTQPPTPPPAPPVVDDDGDVTAQLAAAPARLTDQYAQAARDVEEVAMQARAAWSDDQKRHFDVQLAQLRLDVDRAKDERGKQRAYRAMIRYLQRAAVRDDVALAGVAP